MITALVILSLLTISFSLSQLLDSHFLKELPFALTAIISISYVLGLFDVLYLFKYFYLLLIVISVIHSILAIVNKIKNRSFLKTLFTTFIKPAVFLFAIAIYFAFLINQNKFVSVYDELHHWGVFATSLHRNTSMDWNLTPLANSMWGTYPPSSELLQYIFTMFSKFSEENAFFAMIFFPISVFTYLIHDFSMKQSVKALAIYIVSFYVPMYLFLYFLSTIYVDALLGVAFAYVIFVIIKEDLNILVNQARLLTALVFLILIKNVGFELALIATSLIIAKSLFGKTILKQKVSQLAYLPIIYFINKSWYWYLSLHQSQVSANMSSSSNYTIERIFSIFNHQFPEEYQLGVLNNFIGTINNQNALKLFIHFSYVQWPFILLLILIIVTLFSKNDIKNKLFLLSSYGLLITGYFAYMFSLLVSYLYVFSSFEASYLASVDRYLNTYLVSLFLVFLVLIAQFDLKFKSKPIVYLANAFLIIVAYTVYPQIKQEYIMTEYFTRYSSDIRNIYAKLESFKELIEPDDKVVFLAQNTNGYDYLYAIYLMWPNQLYPYYSFGPLLYDEDISLNLTVPEFEKELMDYDYLFILHTEKRFSDYYYQVFDDPTHIDNNQAYKIIPYNDGKNVSLTLFYE